MTVHRSITLVLKFSSEGDVKNKQKVQRNTKEKKQNQKPRTA